ncbi:MAG: PorT family protein [Bacteroidales bacterium]|nr:PorT family protein [Bacteroidales bacterium]
MKKIFLSAIFGIVLLIPASAQNNGRNNRNNRSYNNNSNRYNFNRWTNNDLGIYYGLRLGLGLSHINSDDKSLDGGDNQSGLNLGFVAGMQVAYDTPIFLESGLYYTEKGGKGYNSDKKFTYNLNYLELPIVMKYQYFINDDVAIQPFAGGYFAYGIGGRIKNYSDREAEDSFSGSKFRRFDGGLRLGCGISFQNIYMDMTYDIGLANISHDTFDASHNGCFYINLGVNF